MPAKVPDEVVPLFDERVRASVAHKAIREQAYAVIDKAFENVDTERAVKAHFAKMRAVSALRAWLAEQVGGGLVPDSCRELASWLANGSQTIWDAYNPYMLALGQSAAKQLADSGLLQRNRENALALGKNIKTWKTKQKKG